MADCSRSSLSRSADSVAVRSSSRRRLASNDSARARAALSMPPISSSACSSASPKAWGSRCITVSTPMFRRPSRSGTVRIDRLRRIRVVSRCTRASASVSSQRSGSPRSSVSPARLPATGTRAPCTAVAMPLVDRKTRSGPSSSRTAAPEAASSSRDESAIRRMTSSGSSPAVSTACCRSMIPVSRAVSGRAGSHTPPRTVMSRAMPRSPVIRPVPSRQGILVTRWRTRTPSADMVSSTVSVRPARRVSAS